MRRHLYVNVGHTYPYCSACIRHPKSCMKSTVIVEMYGKCLTTAMNIHIRLNHATLFRRKRYRQKKTYRFLVSLHRNCKFLDHWNLSSRDVLLGTALTRIVNFSQLCERKNCGRRWPHIFHVLSLDVHEFHGSN